MMKIPALQKPGNTPAEAAPKIGVSRRTLGRYMALGIIGFIEVSAQKKFITDAEIERYKKSNTLEAIV